MSRIFSKWFCRRNSPSRPDLQKRRRQNRFRVDTGAQGARAVQGSWRRWFCRALWCIRAVNCRGRNLYHRRRCDEARLAAEQPPGHWLLTSDFQASAISLTGMMALALVQRGHKRAGRAQHASTMTHAVARKSRWASAGNSAAVVDGFSPFCVARRTRRRRRNFRANLSTN